jgi:competence ComEA-like helix-hairpin-helix protein
MIDPTPEYLIQPSGEVDRAGMWLRRGDQLFVGMLLVVAISLLAVTWIRLNGRGVPLIEIERLPARQYDYQLDINQAEWIEWTLLEGIGEKLAQRIVAYRTENGSFATVEDLRKVPGIGPKTLERIRPWLTVTLVTPSQGVPK